MANLTILVLGSNGFIGKNAVEYFDECGYKVFSPKRQELNLLDCAAVERYLAELKPDVVLMSAVNINSLEANVQIYFNLERCSHLYGQMITIGSGAEYDMRNYRPKMTEDYFKAHIPADTYGLSKFIIGNDVAKSNKNIINLRVFGIFGKYEDYTRRFISNNICRAIAGLDISMNQDMLFDYIYVRDFLAVLPRLFGVKADHRNYNVCSNAPVSFKLLADQIAQVHPHDVRINIKTEGSKGEYSGDNSLFSDEFGPIVETPYEDSIAQLYNWYAEHSDIEAMVAKVRG